MWFNAEAYAEQVPDEQRTPLAHSQYMSVLNSLDRRRQTIMSLEAIFVKLPRKTVALLIYLEQNLYEQDAERLAVLETFRAQEF